MKPPRMTGHGGRSRSGGGQGVRRRGVAARRGRRRDRDRAPPALRRLVAAQGQARQGRELGGRRAARGRGGGRAALPPRPRARADVLRRPQGPRQGRALLADGAATSDAHVQAQRRGRRDPLAVDRRRRGRSPTPTTPSWSARRRSACEPRALPRPRRRLGAPRRPRRHADGRRRDRGDGRLDALRARRQPRRRLRGRARDRRARRVRAGERRRAARRAALGDRLRLQHDRADAWRFAARGRAHARARRRDRLHAPRPRRQRPPVGHRTPSARAPTVRFAEPDRDTLELPASAVEAVLSERTRWVAVTARLQRRRHDPRPRRDRLRRPRAPARASTSTPCTPPRTAGSTSRPSAATPSPARPTSGSARTSASSGRGRSCSRSCRPTSSSPPPTRCPTAGRTARCRSRPWPASPRPPTTSRGMDWDAVRAHEDALLAAALEGLDAIPGVTVHGRARDRTSTLMFTVDGPHLRRGRRRAGRARDRRLARQLLRLGARALPRPRPRRRRPRRLRALQRRGRPRAARSPPSARRRQPAAPAPRRRAGVDEPAAAASGG